MLNPSAGLVLVLVISLWNLASTDAFFVSSYRQPPVKCNAGTTFSMTTTDSSSMSTSDSSSMSTSRRQLLQSSCVAFGCFLLIQPALADVADGSALPQGAAQFSRILRLKVDLVAVEKRISGKASDIDNKEWDDLGQFLRRIYSVGDDMKVVAGGIFDPDQKKQAEEALSLLKRYAQAGDIAVNKKDPEGFVLVIQKLESQVENFLDSLRDVPDEI